MKSPLSAVALLLALSAPAVADLKPDIIDCDAEKAARNAAMKATVGVHGTCDAEKLAEDARDDAGDRLDDARDDVEDRADKARDKHKDKREKREHTLRKDD